MDNTQELLDCLKPVESSMFVSAGYSEAHWTLVLAFRSTGEVKAYANCAPEVADEALSDKSLGGYWNKNIRGNPGWEAETIGAVEVPAKEPKPAKAEPVPEAQGGISDDDIRLAELGWDGETISMTPTVIPPEMNFPVQGIPEEAFQYVEAIRDGAEVLTGAAPAEQRVALAKQTEGEILPAWTAPGSAAEALDLLAERDNEITAIIAQNVKTGEQALTVRVTDEGSNKTASEVLKRIVAKKDTTFAALDPLRKCLYEAYSEAGQKVKAGVEPLEKGERWIKTQISTYLSAQERIRQQKIREAQEAAEAEARRQQEAESQRLTLAEVQDKLEQGDEQGAQTLFDEPIQAPRPYVAPVFVPPAAVKQEGQSTATVWKVDRSLVEDDETGQAYVASIMKFLAAVKHGTFPIEQAAQLLSWDFAAADKLAGALMAAFNVPGLQAGPATTLRVSRGKKKK